MAGDVDALGKVTADVHGLYDSLDVALRAVGGIKAKEMCVVMSRSSFSNGDVAVTFPRENAQVRTLTNILPQPSFGKWNEEER